MYCVRRVNEDIYWVGCNDRISPRFENIHPIPEGTSYNSYLMMDEKTVLFDTTEWEVSKQFLDNLDYVLDGRALDYVVVNHMEPDHGASLELVIEKHPGVKIVCTAKAEAMMKQFSFYDSDERVITVKEGDEMSFGKHQIQFLMAPMVHWPEVMVSYDKTSGTLFSADAFGSFGALNGKLFADEVNYKEEFAEYARRYYTNIVGKYGPQVQALLKKAQNLDVKYICSLHGLVFRTPEDIQYILDQYQLWSTYTPEEAGVLIVYGSMYGGTENCAEILGSFLCQEGVTNFKMYDVTSTHVSTLISKAFQYSHVVLMSVTYNMKTFPPMWNFVEDMSALNLQNRKVAILENGSWAAQSGKLIKEHIESMNNMEVICPVVTVKSKLVEEQVQQLKEMAKNIAESVKSV